MDSITIKWDESPEDNVESGRCVIQLPGNICYQYGRTTLCDHLKSDDYDTHIAGGGGQLDTEVVIPSFIAKHLNEDHYAAVLSLNAQVTECLGEYPPTLTKGKPLDLATQIALVCFEDVVLGMLLNDTKNAPSSASFTSLTTVPLNVVVDDVSKGKKAAAASTATVIRGNDEDAEDDDENSTTSKLRKAQTRLPDETQFTMRRGVFRNLFLSSLCNTIVGSPFETYQQFHNRMTELRNVLAETSYFIEHVVKSLQFDEEMAFALSFMTNKQLWYFFVGLSLGQCPDGPLCFEVENIKSTAYAGVLAASFDNVYSIVRPAIARNFGCGAASKSLRVLKNCFKKPVELKAPVSMTPAGLKRMQREYETNVRNQQHHQQDMIVAWLKQPATASPFFFRDPIIAQDFLVLSNIFNNIRVFKPEEGVFWETMIPKEPFLGIRGTPVASANQWVVPMDHMPHVPVFWFQPNKLTTDLQQVNATKNQVDNRGRGRLLRRVIPPAFDIPPMLQNVLAHDSPHDLVDYGSE